MSLTAAPVALECPECREAALMVTDTDVSCPACSARLKPEEAAEEYVAKILGLGQSVDPKDRDADFVPWPTECPECERIAMVGDIDALGGGTVFACFACGTQWPSSQLDHCDYGDHYYVMGRGEVSGICSPCSNEKLKNF